MIFRGMASKRSKRKKGDREGAEVAVEQNPTKAPEVRKPSGYPFTDEEVEWECERGHLASKSHKVIPGVAKPYQVLVRRLKPYTSEKETPYWKSLKDDPLSQPFAFEYKSRGSRKRKNTAGVEVGGNECMDQGNVVTATLTATQVGPSS